MNRHIRKMEEARRLASRLEGQNMHEIKANGWTYTVKVDDAGKIIGIACKGRFSMAEPKMIGDEWMVTDLQKRIDQLLSE